MKMLFCRALFRVAFLLNRKAIGRQCRQSPSYYAYTCELIRDLYQGPARQRWFTRLDRLMQEA